MSGGIDIEWTTRHIGYTSDILRDTNMMAETESKSAAELRKQNKPLMEKRRRARINDSLNRLKTLVLEALKRDTSRYSKLEKADILEMTVKHLRAVQRQQMAVAMANDSTVINKYRSGFVECASEVTRYLSSIDGLEPQVRNRLLDHLTDCTQKVTAMSNLQMLPQTSPLSATSRPHPILHPMHVQIPSGTAVSSLPGGATYPGSAPPPHTLSSPPSGETCFSGAFHVMPGALPGGQIALLVPSSQGYQLSSVPMGSMPLYTQSARSGGSYTPPATPPASSMSPTSSSYDRNPRFANFSDSSDSEEEVEVALDMRIEPTRDLNANIVKPASSPPPAPPAGSRATSSSSAPPAHARPAPPQRPLLAANVKTEEMWRPW